MVRKIFIILYILFSFTAARAEEQFYKKPSLNSFIHIIQAKNNDPYKCEICLNSFVLMSLHTHNVLFKKAIDNLADYAPVVQLNIIQGLVNLKGKEFLQSLPKNISVNIENIKPNLDVQYIKDLQLKTSASNEKELKEIAIIGDTIWSAYIATGDVKYLHKILSFLANTSIKIRTIEVELKNREAIARALSTQPDIQDLVNSLSKTEKYAFTGYITVLYTLERAQKVDKDIAKKIKFLIKKFPELDYTKAIKL